MLAWFALVPLHVVIDYASSRSRLSIWMARRDPRLHRLHVLGHHRDEHVRQGTAPDRSIDHVVADGLSRPLRGRLCRRTRLDPNDLPDSGILPAPFLWVTLELIRTYFLSGLPWALFGYSQYQWLPIIQLADHFGVYGVSFLLVLVNAALAETIIWSIKAYRGFQIRSFPWPSSVAAAAGFGVALLYGISYLAACLDAYTARTLSVGVVQPNVEQAQKWDVAFRQETMERYDRLTAGLGDDLDLIIWPEAATPFVFEMEPQYRALVSDMARHAGAPLLFGSPALRRYPDGRPFC